MAFVPAFRPSIILPRSSLRAYSNPYRYSGVIPSNPFSPLQVRITGTLRKKLTIPSESANSRLGIKLIR